MAATTEQKQLVEFVPFGTKDKISLSIEIVKRIIAVKTRTGRNCSDEDAFKFMLMCQARKLNPFEGDAFLLGYDNKDQPDKPSFSLITAHQAFLKRAELHPEFDGMDSGTIVLRNGETIDLVGDWHMPNDNILGGWAKVFFKNRSHPMHKRVRLTRFNRNYGVWRDDPAGMVVKCAEADALRSSFPTMLGGMFVGEELPPAEAAEIPRAVFPAPATVVETAAEPPPKKAEPTKKKADPPFKLVEKPIVEARSTEKTAHQKFEEMLALGNCTPETFVKIAVDEGWVTVGKFSEIAPERVEEFMKQGNWEYLVQVIDERRVKAAPEPATTSTTGKLL